MLTNCNPELLSGKNSNFVKYFIELVSYKLELVIDAESVP